MEKSNTLINFNFEGASSIRKGENERNAKKTRVNNERKRTKS